MLISKHKTRLGRLIAKYLELLLFSIHETRACYKNCGFFLKLGFSGMALLVILVKDKNRFINSHDFR